MARAAQRRAARSAGQRRRSSRTRTACASPSPRRAAHGSEVLEADYVVGCDGGHSTVREQIGIERGGTDFDQLMVLAVFRSRELHERLQALSRRARPIACMHPGPEGLLAVLRPGRRRRRLVLPRAGAGRARRATITTSTACCSEPPGSSSPANSTTSASGICASRSPRSYQVGRVFIAGDAAHSHPPYGGYGLNNGLDDVANLGWKLAARLKGWAATRCWNRTRRSAAPCSTRFRARLHQSHASPTNRGVVEQYVGNEK